MAEAKKTAAKKPAAKKEEAAKKPVAKKEVAAKKPAEKKVATKPATKNYEAEYKAALADIEGLKKVVEEKEAELTKQREACECRKANCEKKAKYVKKVKVIEAIITIFAFVAFVAFGAICADAYFNLQVPDISYRGYNLVYCELFWLVICAAITGILGIVSLIIRKKAK